MADKNLDKQQIIDRLNAGESQSSIAKDLGVSRQYIFSLKKAYEETGEGIFHSKTRGRKKERPLSADNKRAFMNLVMNQKPEDLGHEGDTWNVAMIKEWSFQEYGFRLSRTQIRRLKVELDLDFKFVDENYVEEKFDDDFYEWVNSDIAKEIRRREKIYQEKHDHKPKRGRPKKVEIVSDKGVEDDDFDEDVLRMQQLNKETQKAMLKKMAPKKGHGVRTGKHSNQNRNSSKKKKKKKKKKR